MKEFVLSLWQLPQTILGMIVSLCYRKNRVMYHSGFKIIYTYRMIGGLTLGKYIFVSSSVYRKSVPFALSMSSVKHAIGHAYQSRMLGWLYLIVIGIPSAIWGLKYSTKSTKNGNPYYGVLCTERWAEKLSERI